MTKYLVKIKPADMFFFGQEEKYRPKKEGKQIKYEADYYQESAYFPQQTTLLGALRYLLLQINGQLPIINEEVATELIGPESFAIGKNKKMDFGKISNISPVYLMMDGEFYAPAYKYINAEDNKALLIQQSQNQSFEIFGYNEKTGLATTLVNIQDDTKHLKYLRDNEQENDTEYVFIPVEKVGIDKYKRTEAFYKQVFYKFNNDKEIFFAMEVELETGSGIKSNEEYFVPMGAEKQVFIWEFVEGGKIPEVKTNLQIQSPGITVILLLADTFIGGESANDLPLFAISETKPFRFLTSKVQKNCHYGKYNKTKQKYNLFERGSLFFFDKKDKADAFMAHINVFQNFKQIGYNQYKELKNNQ